MVRKGNRGVLLELARKKASETYSFRKGKSRSKAYGTSKDGSPTPKRPKLDKEMRDNRIAELNEIIPDLAKRIAIKESRCQQAETVRNYKLCDELSEEIMHLKSEKREKEKELLLFEKKDIRAKKYEEAKIRRQSDCTDTTGSSRSRSTTPGLTTPSPHSHPFQRRSPFSPLSPSANSVISYSYDASSESESTVPPLSPESATLSNCFNGTSFSAATICV